MLSDAEIAALDDVMYPWNLDDTKFEQERPAMARRVAADRPRRGCSSATPRSWPTFRQVDPSSRRCWMRSHE